MPFKDGEINNPNGRPIGSENKLNSQIKRKLQSILDKLDDPILSKAVTDAKSGELLSFLAKLAPKDINVEHDGEITIKIIKKIIDAKDD